MALKTDYKNDILNVSVNTDRRFQQVDNGDGTLSFVDVTTYQTVGDVFGASDINSTNAQVNSNSSSISSNYSRISAVLGDLAKYESGSYASRAYAVGDYVVRGNYLYRVTAAISSGNQFTSGNTVQTTFGEEITSLKNDLQNISSYTNSVLTNVSSKVTWSTFIARKCGKVAQLTYHLKLNAAAAANETLFFVPSYLFPNAAVYAWSASKLTALIENGRFSLQHAFAANESVVGTMTYITS